MKNFDYFLTQLFRPSETVMFGFWDVLMAMVVSALLCLMLAHVYRATHRGVSYSQSFIMTMLIMSVATSIVMMIIGSNIARAFSLVGALSIIRFRTAVKDPRDTGFLFAAMIVGMGCGTQFYMPAIMLAVFISLAALALYHFDYGAKQRLEFILKVTMRDSGDVQAGAEKRLGEAFSEFKLINRINDFGDGNVTNVYTVRPGKKTGITDLESGLKNTDGVVSVAFYETDQHSPT